MIGFYGIYYVPILLSVCVFLSVLLTLSRSYRDSEMIVWFTSGQSLVAWLRPILLFAAPFIVIIAIGSLWISPWVEQRKQEFEQQLQAREELSLLTPGLFREFRRNDLVVFIESINTFDGTIRNVFAQSTEQGKDVTLVARSGAVVDEANGDRFLVLRDGRRYDTTPGSADVRILEFESLGRRIEPNDVRAVPPSIKAQPTLQLATQASRPQLAELVWRTSIPVSALLLVLTAIPLSYVNPRMGRSLNLASAVLVYMLYSNGISLLQGSIAQGRAPAAVGFVLLHGVVAALVVLMFHRRLQVFGWRRRG
jgi:lipopolysaccharide export system permease protein